VDSGHRISQAIDKLGSIRLLNTPIDWEEVVSYVEPGRAQPDFLVRPKRRV